MKHELCKLADIPAEGSIVVPFFGREAHVYRAGGPATAVANTCLHFGGPLECKAGKLVCPWHGATYDMATRACEAGPAPRSSRLMALSTREEDGALFYVWENDLGRHITHSLQYPSHRRRAGGEATSVRWGSVGLSRLASSIRNGLAVSGFGQGRPRRRSGARPLNSSRAAFPKPSASPRSTSSERGRGRRRAG